MRQRLVCFLLLSMSSVVYAGDSATTTVNWKGIVPSIIPSDSVIITGPNGALPYADSAGLIVKDSTGVFSSDQITLELHHRKCKNGNSAGNCNSGEFIEGEDGQAVDALINDASWTMNSVETVIGTANTLWPYIWTEVIMNGLTMEAFKPIVATSGSVVFTTENKMPMGALLTPGQNIEVHTVISSSKSI